MSDEIRPTNQIDYAVDVYNVSHALLVDGDGNLKVTYDSRAVGVWDYYSGTFWQATQPVSNASLPLPSGASVSAKQPALGTAGSASADVITVQGIVSMTALKTDSSATTQPISGTVTANAGTGSFTVAQGTAANLNATVTGTVAATQSGTWTVQPGNTANTTAWKVDGSAVTQPVSGTFFQATQPISGTVMANIGTSGSLALDASVTGLQIAQASTTSGQKGALAMGTAQSTTPSVLTNGASYPLALTQKQALKTVTGVDNSIVGNQTSVTTCPDANISGAALSVSMFNYGGAFAGTTNAAKRGFSPARTPTVFNTASATASGNTAVWTSGTGNKWRLLQYRILATANVSQTVGGVITVKFQDVAADINVTYDMYVPGVAITTAVGEGYDSGWVGMGSFGILAAATATALNINLSAALATGNIRVMVAGTEE